jgi:hypothetical protein
LIARRYKDICAAILTDQGGDDMCSESKRQLVRRFAAAAVLAEMMEAQLANGVGVRCEARASAASRFRRLRDKLRGDVSPSK